jgi:hypothetical protein
LQQEIKHEAFTVMGAKLSFYSPTCYAHGEITRSYDKRYKYHTLYEQNKNLCFYNNRWKDGGSVQRITLKKR